MSRMICIVLASMAIVLMHFSVTMAYEKEIKEISSSITENISAAGKKTIAVVDFTDLQGNMTELGRFLAEELSVDLTLSAKGFEIIDRTHLKSILAEHKLSITGLVDPNTVKKLGQVAGVDAIVTGTVTPFGDSIRVTCKVIATDTAKVIGASKSDIAKTKAIEELLARGIESGTSASPGLSASPAPQANVPSGAKVFETDSYRLTLNSVRQKRATLTMIITVENISDDELPLGFRDAHLIDEMGIRWNWNAETAGFIDGGCCARTIKLPPKTRARTSVTFTRDTKQLAGMGEAGEGTVFTLGMTEGLPKSGRSIFINDIPAGK